MIWIDCEHQYLILFFEQSYNEWTLVLQGAPLKFTIYTNNVIIYIVYGIRHFGIANFVRIGSVCSILKGLAASEC